MDGPETDRLLMTFGISLFVQESIKTFVGSQSVRYGRPDRAAGPVQIPLVGGFSRRWLYIVAVTVALIAVTYLVLERTDFGLVVRALFTDEPTAGTALDEIAVSNRGEIIADGTSGEVDGDPDVEEAYLGSVEL